jgi:glycosyltransferase involved in cell wall biosynthesis
MVHFSSFPVDSRVQRQAHALADRGAEIDCVCVSSGEFAQGEGHIRLHDLAVAKDRSGIGGYLRGYSSFFVRAARKVAELDRTRHFDLVEVHNMPNFLTFAGAAVKRRNRPVLLDVHDTFPELFATRFGVAQGHPLARLMRLEERMSANYADAIMCVTNEVAERLNARGVGVGRTVTVMNSPDEKIFGSPGAPRALPTTGQVRAVYHGGLAERFGVAPMIEAFALLKTRLPDLSLTICGADHDIRPVVELVARHGADNVFVEPNPHPVSEIPDVLRASHLGIVPTVHDTFTELLLPVKLLECVHMGLPVVASRLPVITRYFSEDEVRYFEPGSASSLAEGILDLIEHPELAQAAARRAAQRLRDFAWDRQRETYLALIDRLVGDGRSIQRG